MSKIKNLGSSVETNKGRQTAKKKMEEVVSSLVQVLDLKQTYISFKVKAHLAAWKLYLFMQNPGQGNICFKCKGLTLNLIFVVKDIT